MFNLSPMVKNLLIFNVGIFIISLFFSETNRIFALYGYFSPNFKIYQHFTYMFLHADTWHIFGNMLGLVIFGPLLERVWGDAKFLKFYMITGIGAGVLYALVNMYEFSEFKNDVINYRQAPSPTAFLNFLQDHYPSFRENPGVVDFLQAFEANQDNEAYKVRSVEHIEDFLLDFLRTHGGMVGASGAVYGILLAIGMLFPNTVFMLIFPPIPVKAKYLALALGIMAVFGAIHKAPGDKVAHFAHLGGMLIGYILLRIWKQDRNSFY